MPVSSKTFLYGLSVLWKMERDKLDASFTRIGSGFVTKGVVSEAVETNNRITQILSQIQMLQGTHGKIETISMPLSFYREHNGRMENDTRLS